MKKTDRELFVLPDNGKEDVPMVELDYYKWLDSHRGVKLGIDSKKAYLASLGFDKEKHTLGDNWERILTNMRYVEDCYYYSVIDKNN